MSKKSTGGKASKKEIISAPADNLSVSLDFSYANLL